MARQKQFLQSREEIAPGGGLPTLPGSFLPGGCAAPACDQTGGVRAAVLPESFDPARPADLAAAAALIRESGAARVVWMHPPGAAAAMALVAQAAAWSSGRGPGVAGEDPRSRGVTVLVPAAALPVLVQGGRAPTVRCGPVPMLCFPPLASAPCRWPDMLAAALALLLAAPLLLAAALAVRLEDGGPAFFLQMRDGRNGRPFRIFKLRTMRPGAEALRPMRTPADADGRACKPRRDPRLTVVGRGLRRFSVDELPQLLNVLRGEMRLVGPRPLPVCEPRPDVPSWTRLRLEGVPGMTGLWQVSGRNARTFEEMCLLDIWYLRNRSWRLDLSIALRTAGAVLRG